MKTQLHFDYDILLEFTPAVTNHAFVLRCLPPSFPGQEIPDVQLTLEPAVPYALQKDSFGNLLQVGRIGEAHDHFRYTVRGTAWVNPALRQAEPAHPVFRFASPYTALSPEMASFLRTLPLPEAPAEKAFALCEAVHHALRYTPGSTGISTRAAEAFSAGHGVCQDFAHIYLALARASGLYARYASGLPVGEGTSHAWCEVWLNGIWTGIDPTRGEWCSSRYIRFNTGRDYGDCPMERGIFTGVTQQKQRISMRVTEQ